MNVRSSIGLGWILAAAALGGCSHATGSFVWADDLPQAKRDAAESMIATGDLISIHIFDHDPMSGRGRVRSDGRFSLPLLDDVIVAGKTPVQVAREVEALLRERSLVLSPTVNVVLEETKPLAVSVLGEVSRPGIYTLDPAAGVAEALAASGGLTEFAHKDRIFVVRRMPQLARIRFRFEALTQAKGVAASFRLQAGDVVVAE